ncbi:MAG: carbamoyltransferase HypF [Methylococcales bacterium]|nr:carbamoyltransferase HypF [Methylococcales bacterium]
MKRIQITLTGLLQGIGFRPYVYRLATAHQLSGWVANDRDRVLIEVEGETEHLAEFLAALQTHVPACGHISDLQERVIPATYQQDFQFKPSLNADSEAAIFACPDIVVCDACVAELFDPQNRRYQHPFISCCHCGPRYSVMYGLPYDREKTSLRDFPLCEQCATEYKNPNDRRFYAQTIACPDCGPQLTLCDNAGKSITHGQAAIDDTVNALKAGKIVAVKAIGGFQLLLDANNSAAVTRLRMLKQRASKPFAVMVASLAQAEQLCELSEQEQRCLCSAAAPIVLARAKSMTASPLRDWQSCVNNAAPNQALLGIMLPSSPIHHLIMAQLAHPVIATSGNRHGEPICIDNQQAFEHLNGLADFFLVHDREILRPLDDSIIRVISDTPTVFRRARGYVPTPIKLKQAIPTTLAVGAQLKNTVAIAHGHHVIVSQHLGDLEQLETAQQFSKTIADVSQFYALTPERVISDTHPDYVSSLYAQQSGLPVQTVQHHYAHILACMAEHQLQPPVLGIAWDGTGLGTDKQLWGGEFLQIEPHGWQRVAHCRPFPLVGGFAAIKEPRRAALGLLYAWQGEAIFNEEYAPLLSAFSVAELKLLRGMLKNQLNCPMTTSIGRLFDAFASLLGLCHISEFEGQAAMALEACAMNNGRREFIRAVMPTARINSRPPFHSWECSNGAPRHAYPTKFIEANCLILDWQPILTGVLADLNKTSPEQIAANIHRTLANWVFAVTEKTHATRLVFSGGCFQNAYLVDAIVNAEQAKHYQLFRHATIPPNDGGLALGQIYARVLATVEG